MVKILRDLKRTNAAILGRVLVYEVMQAFDHQ